MKSILAVILLAAGLLYSPFYFIGSSYSEPVTPLAGPVVKVVVKGGHGTGFSIGNRRIVTAAHVVDGVNEAVIVADDGRKAEVEVLWVNKARDIALLKLKGGDFLTADRLSCKDAHEGDAIHVKGSPLDMDWVTMWGHIAGDKRNVGHWPSAYVADITILPGNSGGPVYADNGDVIGIAVGVALVPLGFSASVTGMTYVVPSSEVCDLLAISET